MQEVKDYIKECFDDFTADAENKIKNETIEEIERYKKCKNDSERIAILTSLLGEAVNILITDKEKFEAKIINARNNNTLYACSGYDKLLNNAIDSLRKKEELEKSLEDINKRIESNEEILIDIRKYYEGKKKRR